jgi:hypothetical protein
MLRLFSLALSISNHHAPQKKSTRGCRYTHTHTHTIGKKIAKQKDGRAPRGREVIIFIFIFYFF